jgi:hypothetical protein
MADPTHHGDDGRGHDREHGHERELGRLDPGRAEQVLER